MINKDTIQTVTKIYFFDGSFTYNVVTENLKISVPLDPANTDYQAIQEWIAEGNTVIDNGANN